jgi:hypothetical protein
MTLVLSEFGSIHTSAKPRLLICDSGGASLWLEPVVKSRKYVLDFALLSRPIPLQLRALLSDVELVLLDLTTSSRDVLNTIQELTAAIGIGSPRPRLICVSSVPRNPQFVLRIQQSGAQYVRIANPEMLFEAIDLSVAELDDIETNGPCFQIVHRFSPGICTPGEEVSAVFLAHAGNFLQLPLGLAERFVFDFLAQRRIAVDSLQIVSGLFGDRFYSEHAANSGRRQVKRIRRATVKVLAQRIRDAMARTLGCAALSFDSYDILRSCPTEGTNRVLYKLCARVSWRHLP